MPTQSPPGTWVGPWRTNTARRRHPIQRCPHAVHGEVILPERLRRVAMGHDRPDARGFALAAEHAVGAGGAHLHAAELRPAEQGGVEAPGALGVGGAQLVPGGPWPAGGVLQLVRRLDDGEERSLGIGEDRDLADAGDVVGADVDGAAGFRRRPGGGVAIVHRDIADPARRRAVLLRLHQPAPVGASCGEEAVEGAGNAGIPRVPAEHRPVECGGRHRVVGHQLVPAERAVR